MVRQLHLPELLLLRVRISLRVSCVEITGYGLELVVVILDLLLELEELVDASLHVLLLLVGFLDHGLRRCHYFLLLVYFVDYVLDSVLNQLAHLLQFYVLVRFILHRF